MSNELALRSSAELPAVSGPPSPAEWQAMREQCEVILVSGMAPKALNTPQKVLAVCLKGRELRLPPMQALTHIHIVEGRPTLSAECMVALVQRAGHKIRVLETDDQKCTIEGERGNDPLYRPQVTFSMEDAKQAGVASRGPWKQYPAAMLRARAISALCRFAFADVLMGASYVPEELGAEVNEEGEIIDMPGGATLEGADSAGRGPFREDHQTILDEIGDVLGAMPPEARPEKEAEVWEYAKRKLPNARATLQRLNRKLDEALESEEAEQDAAMPYGREEDEEEVNI